jgi:biotin carboxyl carrier protein
MNFKRTGIFLTIMSMLLISMVGGELLAEDSAAATVTPCPKKVSVTLETVQTGVFMEYQYLSGKGQAGIIAVKSPIGGVLSEVLVSEGSLVDAGQNLAVLNAGANEEIKKLEEAAAKAKKILTARQNWKEKSEKAIQSAANAYQKALDLLNAKKAESNLTVQAPVAGIVHRVMAAGGEIEAAALLLEIANPLQLVFQSPLAPADKDSLAVGDKFSAMAEGFRGEVAAEVIALGDATVTLRVDNESSQFREGAGFTFQKLIAEHAEAIAIPGTAIQKDSLGDFVYVAEKKRAKKLYVTLGASSDGKTLVENGLVAGAALVVSGLDCLADGKKIRIVNEEELAKQKSESQAMLKQKEAEEAAATLAKQKEDQARKEAAEAKRLKKEQEQKEKAEAAEAKKLKKEQEKKAKAEAAAARAAEKEAAAASGKEPCPKKVSVTLETVQTGVFMEYQYLSGKGRAEIVAVKSPIGGVLSEVLVSEGSLVDAGQDLAVLNAGANEEIMKLEEAAAKAKKILTARQNWKEKSEKAIQAAADDYQKALDLLNAKIAQSNLTIKAPVAGIVHRVMAAGGEIEADALLLEIANPLQLVFQIPLAPADKGSLAVGDKFSGTAEGLRGEVTAEVIALGDGVVTLRVNNENRQFREGVGFTFKKLKAEHAEAIAIPSESAQKDALGDFVYMAEKKRAKKLYVILGPSSDGRTLVEKGLADGAALIVSGFDCLADHKKIRIVNAEQMAKEKAEAEARRKEKQVSGAEARPVIPGEAEKAAIIQPSRFRAGLTFARFSINDKNMRDFYADWFKNIPGIELSIHTMHNIDVWLSGKIFNEDQQTTYFEAPIKFKLLPLAVGLRYRFPKYGFVEPFVGAGLNFYSYKESVGNESDLGDTKDSATGFHFQGGTYFHLKRVRLMLGEIFLKYNIVKKTLTELLPDGTDKLDLGGFEMGIGLLVKF